MKVTHRVLALSLIVGAGACADAATAPRALPDGVEDVATAKFGHHDVRTVKMMDTCDTESFDAVLGAGSCVIDRGTTFDQMIHQLEQHQTAQSWRFNPIDTKETVGTTLEIRNDGGEVHTFTRVAQFGGGFVDELNQLTGNPVPVPECLNFGAITFVPSGGSETQTLPSAGPNLYQCCIHPWMRSTIEGR